MNCEGSVVVHCFYFFLDFSNPVSLYRRYGPDRYTKCLQEPDIAPTICWSQVECSAGSLKKKSHFCYPFFFLNKWTSPLLGSTGEFFLRDCIRKALWGCYVWPLFLEKLSDPWLSCGPFYWLQCWLVLPYSALMNTCWKTVSSFFKAVLNLKANNS